MYLYISYSKKLKGKKQASEYSINSFSRGKILKSFAVIFSLILVSTCTDTTFRRAKILEPLKLLNVNIT